MNAQPREELVSAYVDGELSAVERAQVEGWLAESAELRQLHDELLALRGGLQSLPRHKLEHDLGPSVLRRAERAVLGGAAPRPVAQRVGPFQSWWLRGTWRRWAWPAVAIAAALLMMVVDRQQRPAEREVAKAPVRDVSVKSTRDDGYLKAAPSAAEGANEHDASVRALDDESDHLDVSRKENVIAEKKSAASAKPMSAPSQNSAAAGAARPALVPQETPSDASAPDKARRAMPLAGGAEKRGAIARPTPQPAEEDERVVFEVSGEFIRERAFEKLLDTNKLVWQRAQNRQSKEPVPQTKLRLQVQRSELLADEALEPVAKDQAPPPAAPRVDYFVEAAPEQLDEIVVELNNARGLKQVAGGRAQNQKAARDLKQKQQPSRRMIFTLQTPTPPETPAAPPAGQEKP